MTYLQFPRIGESYIFPSLEDPGYTHLPHFFSHSLVYCPSLCPLAFPLLFYPPVLLAYQLRVCQPPPEVPNADMLTEDGELEIGI